MTLTTLPGNPNQLSSSVDTLDRAAYLIQEASETLRQVAVEGRGQTMTALQEVSTGLARRLDDAHRRYAGTTSALRVYSVELAGAHVTANQAIDIDREGRLRLNIAERNLDEATLILQQAQMNGSPQSVIDEAIRDYNNARWLHNDATAEIQNALALYHTAELRMNAAADTAITGIISAFETTNDSVMDRVGALLAPLADFATAIAKWVGEVLKAVLDLIVAVVEIVAEALVLVVTAILVVVAIVVVLALAIVVIAELLIALGIALQLFELTELLGLDDLAQLRLVALVIGTICPLAGLVIAGEIYQEVNSPTPEVRRVDNVDEFDPATDDESMYFQALQALPPPDSVDDLMRREVFLDPAGKSDQTVVDFQKIVDADGTVRWIVTLPSTQDWNMGSDPGAVNDLGGNLVMLLCPELQTQYERALLDAMKGAGIEPGDQLMLVGFSQGGILAGLMSEKYANGGDASLGGYNITDIVTAGSPIEGFDIPDSVHVISAEHTWDPVHQLDMHMGGNPSNYETITGGHEWVKPLDAHNAANYAVTMFTADEESGYSFTAELQEFLGGDATATLPNGQPAYEHFDYAFSE